MTDNEIIIEVAKLDGFTKVRPRTNVEFVGYAFDGESYITGLHPKFHILQIVPSYLTSRDAIIPVIGNIYNGKPHECINEFERLLMLGQGITASTIPLMRGLYATPRQFCIALLKATGKWKE